MGCATSKNQVHDVIVAKDAHILFESNKTGQTRRANRCASRESISNGCQSERGNSATSKTSKHSGDSGFTDEEYAQVITENSDPDQVKSVREQFETPRDLELNISGEPCRVRLSAKERTRREEQQVLDALRAEGLIQCPVSQTAKGVSFNIVAEDTALNGMVTTLRPPARLAKLERRRRKKRTLTEEDIQRKMESAERRRKEQEEERLAKIQAVSNQSNVLNSREIQGDREREEAADCQSRMDNAIENRTRQLEDLRDKLRRKQEYADRVRTRKQLMIEETHPEHQT